MYRTLHREACRDAHEVLARLLEILEAIDQERDDWVVFLYNARRQYERAAAKVNKSGKKVRDTGERLCFEAGHRGYKGTYQDWIHLMRIPFKHVQVDAFAQSPERERRNMVKSHSGNTQFQHHSHPNPLPP